MSTEADRTVVRNQLARIVNSPLFRQSKRCPRLLTHVVDLTLTGDLERLKERTLGVEVFEHDPDYDTNQFPVVRTTAHEIRKRLAQYYQEPGRESELRIDLPPGSYVPEFHTADSAPAPAATAASVSRSRRFVAPLVALVTVAALMLAATLLRPRGALDRFWAPIMQSSDPILFSLGPGGPAQDTATENGVSASDVAGPEPYTPQQPVELGDAVAFASIAGYVRSEDGQFRARMTNSVQFQDLKASPVIFIGPVTRWMELLAPDLRFAIHRNEEVTLTWISDRENPDDRTWSMAVGAPPTSVIETYALVTRMWSPTTGQSIVSVAGLSSYGTGAAGELLADPSHMEELARGLPKDWASKNMQIVIATQRVGTGYSTPRVVSTHFW